MVVLGDGWERPWIHQHTGDGVEFKRCQKAEFYGHRNVYEAVKGVTTSYWGWLGDDDLLLPGAFNRVREMFETGEVIVTEVMQPNGRFLGALRERSSERGRIAIAGWQAFVPRGIEIPDFSTLPDTELFDQLLIALTHRRFRFLHNSATALIRFPQTTRAAWEGTPLQDLFQWESDLVKWREPDWNPE